MERMTSADILNNVINPKEDEERFPVVQYEIGKMHSLHMQLTPYKSEIVVNELDGILKSLNIGSAVVVNITIQRVSETIAELGGGFVTITVT